MNIFLDIDNTICKVNEKEEGPARYTNAEPIYARIAHANKLYDDGNRITYWTARGKASGKDYSELTRQQLAQWNVKYHDLRFDKPSYDLYVDDKSENTTKYFETVDRFATPVRVPKGWGYELIITNTPKYCGKIMHFNKGAKFSMHYHILKTETWYVYSGKFEFKYINTANATVMSKLLNVGDVVTNEIGQPHQIICLEEGDVFEVSTEHFDSDSYRVFPGDSQCAACEEKPDGVFLGHLGLGDQILLAPAMAKCASECKTLYIITKAMYKSTMEAIFANKNVVFITITDSPDMAPQIKDINEVFTRLPKGIKVYASGMYSRTRNPLVDFPVNFYKDLQLDWNNLVTAFEYPTTERSRSLAELLGGREYTFVHLNASDRKIQFTKSPGTLVINPEENMYEPGEEYYELANRFIRSNANLTVADYKDVMCNASKLSMIDSCYFAFAAMLDTKASERTVYYRHNAEFKTLTKGLWKAEFI